MERHLSGLRPSEWAGSHQASIRVNIGSLSSEIAEKNGDLGCMGTNKLGTMRVASAFTPGTVCLSLSPGELLFARLIRASN